MRYVYLIVFLLAFLLLLMLNKTAKKVYRYNEEQKTKKSCSGSCESCGCEEQTY